MDPTGVAAALVVAVVCACLSWVLATRAGMNRWLWGVVGFLFGPVGFLVAAAIAIVRGGSRGQKPVAPGTIDP